jgi:tryptophanyl-tRNA synthetase
VLKDFGNGPFSTFKQALADLAVERLSPIAGEMRRLTADPAEIDRILADGAARARAIAQPVLRNVKRIVGFVGA